MRARNVFLSLILLAPVIVFGQVEIDALDTIRIRTLQNPCPPGSVHIGDSVWVTSHDVQTIGRERVWWPGCDGETNWRTDEDLLRFDVPIESRVVFCKDTTRLYPKDGDFDLPDEPKKLDEDEREKVKIEVTINTNGKETRNWFTNRAYLTGQLDRHVVSGAGVSQLYGAGFQSTSFWASRPSNTSDWRIHPRLYAGVEVFLAISNPVPFSSCDTCWVIWEDFRSTRIQGEVIVGAEFGNPQKHAKAFVEARYRFLDHHLDNEVIGRSWLNDDRFLARAGVSIDVPINWSILRGLRFQAGPQYDLLNDNWGGNASVNVVVGKSNIHYPPIPIDQEQPFLVPYRFSQDSISLNDTISVAGLPAPDSTYRKNPFPKFSLRQKINKAKAQLIKLGTRYNSLVKEGKYSEARKVGKDFEQTQLRLENLEARADKKAEKKKKEKEKT